MCPAHMAKSHFTDIAVSGRFPYSYAYRATQTAMKKPPAMQGYRGKYAKLSTCNRELTYRDAHGNSFRFDGDELVCDKYRIGGFMPFSSSGYAQMRIPVTDDMQVKITDSNQVTDQTVLM